jgi:hypothetical protein
MNQEVANHYISHTGTILCLDVPEKTEFGIDNNCWVVGNMFKGIKLIPLGLHLVYMKYVLSFICYLHFIHSLAWKVDHDSVSLSISPNMR